MAVEIPKQGKSTTALLSIPTTRAANHRRKSSLALSIPTFIQLIFQHDISYVSWSYDTSLTVDLDKREMASKIR